jgi:hypothetical protein
VAQDDGSSNENFGLTSRIAQEAKDAGIDPASLFDDDSDESSIVEDVDGNQATEASAGEDGGPDGTVEGVADQPEEATPEVEAPETEIGAAPEAGSIEARLVDFERRLADTEKEKAILQGEKDRHLNRVKELEGKEFERTQADSKTNLERIRNMADLEKIDWVDRMVDTQLQPASPEATLRAAQSQQYENRLRGLRAFYPEGESGDTDWRKAIGELEGEADIDLLLVRLAEGRATSRLETSREAVANAAAANGKSEEGAVVDTGGTPARKASTYDQLVADFLNDDSDFGRKDNDIESILEAARREGKENILPSGILDFVKVDA